MEGLGSGEVVYRDRKSARMVLAFRLRFFLPFLASVVVIVGLIPTFESALQVPLIAAVFGIMVVFGILGHGLLRHWRPLTVFRTGIRFAHPYLLFGERQLFPFSEVEWAFYSPGTPWVGVMVGLRGGGVWPVHLGEVDPEPFLAALSGRVDRPRENPFVVRALSAFDAAPDNYLELWGQGTWRDVPPMIVALAVTSVLLLAMLLVLAANIRGWTTYVVVLGVMLFALYVAARLPRRQFPSFELTDLKPAHMVPLIEGFLRRQGRLGDVGRGRFSRMWPANNYVLPGLGAVFRLERARGGLPGWRGTLRAEDQEHPSIRDFQVAFGRFALEKGLSLHFPSRVESLLWDLEHPDEEFAR